VQVEVHHVHAEVAGARLADERVHVGAVHVEQRALGVQDVGDLVDFALEDADRGRVGEHQRGDVFVHHALEFGEVDHAQRVRLEVRDLVAAGAAVAGLVPCAESG
jgi:2C-methyl-D-erythritol 2,4-cyclodiphosphate synthase